VLQTQPSRQSNTTQRTSAFEGVKIMSSFSEIILKAINDYRTLLRKTVPAEERKTKLRQLGLDGRYSELHDLDLYEKAEMMTADLRNNLSKEEESSQYTYSGNRKFIEHLTNILDQYHVHGTKILHCTQLASRAIIESIQILSLPEDQLRLETNIKKLAKSNYLIARFGSDFQRDTHITSLKNNRENNKPFFDGILSNFETTLQKIKQELEQSAEA
jgi:hypothetical protein